MSQDEQAGSAGPGRWRIHRGGVINIWQFAQQTFDYSGGRVIFHGTNGSGKSRTLELQIPLTLDGDLNYMGVKGHNSTSMRDLLLEDYHGGAVRIGYAWLELHRAGADGGDEYLTCGVGAKASKRSESQKADSLTGSWRFVTDARIGHGLELTGPDEVPLDSGELKTAIEAANVYGPDENTAFQRRIASTVYGITDLGRYADLLNLQRTLRNPDIGVRAAEGALAQSLSDALPPLNPDIVLGLAEKFSDLDSIEVNIDSLREADKALQGFMGVYRGYVRGQFDKRAGALRRARTTLKSQQDKNLRLRTTIQDLQQAADGKAAQVTTMEGREAELVKILAQLQLPEELRSIDRKSADVAGLARTAASTAAAAGATRTTEEGAVAAILACLRSLDRVRAAAAAQAERCRAEIHKALLDRGLVPSVPQVPGAKAAVAVQGVRTGPDRVLDLTDVQRHTPPAFDLPRHREDLERILEQAQLAESAARRLEPVATQLAEHAEELAAAADVVEDLRAKAQTAAGAVVTASGESEMAKASLATTAQNWAAEAARWIDDAPADPDARRTAPPAPDAVEVETDAKAADRARRAARTWAEQQQRDAENTRQAAADQARRADTEIGQAREQLADTEAGIDIPPPRHPHATAERDPDHGAAFHQLVDFRPGTGETERAGLEAALQACGLLDAFVLADGRVTDPQLADILASAGDEPAGGPTLADILVPVTGDHSPVSAQAVQAILAAVRLGDGPGLSVTASGNWRAGVLHGRWAKAHAEHIGAAARAAARERRSADLRSRITDLTVARTAAETARDTAAAAAAAWRTHLEDYPETGALVGARETAAAKDARFRQAEHDADAAAAAYESAQAAWQIQQDAVRRQAADHSLPPEAQALRAIAEASKGAVEQLQQLRDTITDQWSPQLSELEQAADGHEAAVLRRIQTEQAAEGDWSRYDAEAAALQALKESLTEDAQQAQETLAALAAEAEKIRIDLPLARKQHTGAVTAHVKAEAAYEKEYDAEQTANAAVADAEDAFTDAVDTPGLWHALTGDPGDPPQDRDDALAVLAATPSTTAADEAAVYQQQYAARDRIGVGRDLSISERRGILTVEASDDEGHRPVADVARRTAERLQREQAHLSKEYAAILHKYLLQDLSEHLRAQIAQAQGLTARMNQILADAQSSQGVHVQLAWEPSAAVNKDILDGLALLTKNLATRTAAEDEQLRAALNARIEAERDANPDYTAALGKALDYRQWHQYTIKVQDIGPDGKLRPRRMGKQSSGELRMISYVTLFAAAASFYDALQSDGQRPLRVVMLDEAFERIDGPTVTRMLEMLVDLDMDWIITWPGKTALSPKIPRYHIYDVLKRRNAWGLAFSGTTWDGGTLQASVS